MSNLTVLATSESSSMAALLLDTSDIIREIAQLVHSKETDKDRQVFLSHLAFHCSIFRYHLQNSRQVTLPLEHSPIPRILKLLGSLLVAQEQNLGCQLPRAVSSDFLLRQLNLEWRDMPRRDDDSKFALSERWMNLEMPSNVYTELDTSLQECGADLAAHEIRDFVRQPIDKFAPPDIGEPPYTVSTAAQSAFDALSHCRGCTCPERHDIGAKLSLGTYRAPTTTKHIQPMHRITARKTKTSSVQGGTEFDLFLARERDWQEFRIKTVKETVARLAAAARDDPTATTRRDYDTKSRRLDVLCRRIAETVNPQTTVQQRLVLELTRGQLFELRLERSNFLVDRNVQPISLASCFETRHDFFTEKVKRILALVLSYAVLHFHGTSWLQPGWGSSNVKFFQTTTSKTPLRPFIETPLPVAGSSDTGAEFPILVDDRGDYDTSEMYLGHHCPELIGLAVVLIELYCVAPFQTVAKHYGVDLIPTETGGLSLPDVLLVFYGSEEHNIKGCRSDIPEDCPFLTAIDNCLDVELWEDEDGNLIDTQTTRPRMYQNIVLPLETHLKYGFKDIPLGDLDRYAQDVDFGNWGQTAQIERHTQPSTMELPLARNSQSQPVTFSTLSEVRGGHSPAPDVHAELQELAPSLQESVRSSNAVCFPHTAAGLVTAMEREEDKSTSRFFDDETPDGEHAPTAVKNYAKWKSNYEKVYGHFIANHPSSKPQPVKIAILDTGIDRGNPNLLPRHDKIKECLNWYNEDTKADVSDGHGHGTFNASLLLDYAPDAELYIAKIAGGENQRPSAHIVAKAINHAVLIWQVDIMSMSFGWPSRDFEGYDELQAAIDNASTNKVLMFAAASNSGGRQGRAYPARTSNVICIHSTDTYGAGSRFSPTASPYDLNLATVGEWIESAWPSSLCKDQTNRSCVTYKSGTSYANAIAAGIAGYLLQYARIHLSQSEALALKRRDLMMAVLKRVAERGPSYKPRDDYCYIELSLSPDNLFGQGKQWIDLELSRILRD